MSESDLSYAEYLRLMRYLIDWKTAKVILLWVVALGVTVILPTALGPVWGRTITPVVVAACFAFAAAIIYLAALFRFKRELNRVTSRYRVDRVLIDLITHGYYCRGPRSAKRLAYHNELCCQLDPSLPKSPFISFLREGG